MTHDDLEGLFARLRSEDRAAAPDFRDVMDRARNSASSGHAVRQTASWWRAIPLGSALAAAGIGAIALTGGPSSSETRFQDAVRWTDANPLFASVGVPSDALLGTPQWAVLRTGSPSPGIGSGLSRMLEIDRVINDERNNS
ncbi:MAG: hypothetical protein OEO23_02475 [Gemmatimonadota bacterium]|nr:hypothetical protein [Gemmatimonadota bacterium]